MIKESALRECLMSLVDILKSQTELMVSVMAELAAVRETVRALDPTFDDTLIVRRQQALQSVLPSAQGLVGALELITLKLKSGDVC